MSPCPAPVTFQRGTLVLSSTGPGLVSTPGPTARPLRAQQAVCGPCPRSEQDRGVGITPMAVNAPAWCARWPGNRQGALGPARGGHKPRSRLLHVGASRGAVLRSLRGRPSRSCRNLLGIRSDAPGPRKRPCWRRSCHQDTYTPSQLCVFKALCKQ